MSIRHELRQRPGSLAIQIEANGDDFEQGLAYTSEPFVQQGLGASESGQDIFGKPDILLHGILLASYLVAFLILA